MALQGMEKAEYIAVATARGDFANEIFRAYNPGRPIKIAEIDEFHLFAIQMSNLSRADIHEHMYRLEARKDFLIKVLLESNPAGIKPRVEAIEYLKTFDRTKLGFHQDIFKMISDAKKFSKVI
jgi:hypothetical protein